MYKMLIYTFRRLKGQPVLIYTDDGRRISGLVLNVFEDGVRLVDKCGRIIDVEFGHIDSVVEPQMDLDECCYVEEDDC